MHSPIKINVQQHNNNNYYYYYYIRFNGLFFQENQGKLAPER